MRPPGASNGGSEEPPFRVGNPPGRALPPRVSLPRVRVVGASDAAAWDRATIERGVPSRALMQRAGAAAAGEIARRYAHRLSRGVAIFAGPGNNGGDAWVVARALAASGVDVRVQETGSARTDDARAERELAMRSIGTGPPTGAEEVVVDGVLGTGAKGAPRDAAADAVARITACRATGASVVALDVPSGLDASTGDAELAVTADLTLTFGSLKRGHLTARGRCGRIVVLDIGLDPAAGASFAALVDVRWVRAHVPAIAADAHKGTRKRLAVVGGAMGMTGAAVLAGRAASRSGIGMVRLVVPAQSVPVVQMAAPELLASAWPETDAAVPDAISAWSDVVVIGPGLGRSRETRDLVERVLRGWGGPVLLDADALNVFERDAAALGAAIGGRAAVLTPHPAELARLLGTDVPDVLSRRFEIALEAARTMRATVLLKGVPTVISSPDGTTMISAAGTPALAAAGSGDVLAGIAATLLAQSDDPLAAASCAAWMHGRAAELASGLIGGSESGFPVLPESEAAATPPRGGAPASTRGVTLETVLDALPAAWRVRDAEPCYPVIAELPAVGGDQWPS